MSPKIPMESKEKPKQNWWAALFFVMPMVNWMISGFQESLTSSKTPDSTPKTTSTLS